MIQEATKRYDRDGFCLLPPVLPPDLIGRTVERMQAVMRGEYETGRAPMDWWWKPTDPVTKLRKIDQPHVADRTIFEAVTHPALGRQIAEIMGAKFVQVWAVQLLYKPPGGDVKGAVGWHQDYQYWKTWWTPDSNVFTAWLALTDVREESGPMRFVPGSHRWGLREGGDFFGSADDRQREQIGKPADAKWSEVSATMPAGAFSLHHRLTVHGSSPNVSDRARCSFAIHVRTERSTPTPQARRLVREPTGDYTRVRYLDDVAAAGNDPSRYVDYLDDLLICPVIYQA